MAIKIRQCKSTKGKFCHGCDYDRKVKAFYEIGIGPSNNLGVTTLCDKCMHELLQKMIHMGGKFNGV